MSLTESLKDDKELSDTTSFGNEFHCGERMSFDTVLYGIEVEQLTWNCWIDCCTNMFVGLLMKILYVWHSRALVLLDSRRSRFALNKRSL